MSHRIRTWGKPVSIGMAAFTLAAWYAFLNGFPLIHTSDTVGYLQTLKEQSSTSAVWPVGYGWFVKALSFGNNLWWPIVAQIVLVLCIFYACIHAACKRISQRWLLCTIALVGLGTRFPRLIGSIHPDVFVGIIPILTYLIIRTADNRKIVALCLILTGILLMHISFLPISIIVVTLVSILGKVGKKNLLLLGIAHAAASLYFIGAYTRSDATRHARPPGYHYFFVGRMAESGYLTSFLYKHCDQERYILCDHIETIDGMRTSNFVWRSKHAWSTDATGDNQREVLRIALDILKKDPVGFALQTPMPTMQALVAPFAYYPGAYPVKLQDKDLKNMVRFYPNHEDDMRHSLQYTNDRLLKWTSGIMVRLEHVLFLASVIMLGGVLVAHVLDKIQLSDAAFLLILCATLTMLANAFVCANGSGFVARYYFRLFWLLPFTTMVVIGTFIEGSSSLRKNAKRR